MSEFTTKDSGERTQFDSGMVRDTTTGKARPDLIRSGPMFQRWTALLTRGAIKYDANNWMKAKGQAELDRFLESAARHFEIWFMWRRFGINIEVPNSPTTEPLTEDHAAAVFFNVNGSEYAADRLTESKDVRETKRVTVEATRVVVDPTRCPQDGQPNCCPGTNHCTGRCLDYARNNPNSYLHTGRSSWDNE